MSKITKTETTQIEVTKKEKDKLVKKIIEKDKLKFFLAAGYKASGQLDVPPSTSE